MTPTQLRKKVGASADRVARRMGLSPRAFRALEACPVSAWTVHQLASYVEALDWRLVVTAAIVAPDGVTVHVATGEAVTFEVSP